MDYRIIDDAFNELMQKRHDDFSDKENALSAYLSDSISFTYDIENKKITHANNVVDIWDIQSILEYCIRLLNKKVPAAFIEDVIEEIDSTYRADEFDLKDVFNPDDIYCKNNFYYEVLNEINNFVNIVIRKLWIKLEDLIKTLEGKNMIMTLTNNHGIEKVKTLELVKIHVFKNQLVSKIARDSNGIFYRYQYWINAYSRLNDACQSYLTKQAQTMTIEINEPDYRKCFFLADL